MVHRNDTGDIGTGDICNAEVFLGDVGHGKAERHADDGDALGVGIALVQPCHSKVSHNAHAHGSGKEQHRINEHLAQTRAGAGACAQYAGEDYDADDIINDGGTDDGGAEKALQVAQLLQGCHRNGHAGGRHDGADEQCAVKLRAAHRRKAVECAIQQRTAYQRHKDADAGDQRRNGACAHQLLQVRAKTGGEHQQHHTDFRKNRDSVAGLHQVQQARSDDQAGNDFAHDLRGLAFAGDQRKELCAQNDDRQVTEHGIHEISSPYLLLDVSYPYSFSTLRRRLQEDKTCKICSLHARFAYTFAHRRFFAKKCKIRLDI